MALKMTDNHQEVMVMSCNGDCTITGKVVHAETTTAHSVLNGMQYYHQDWCYAAAHVTVPPLRLDPSTPNYLMSLLGK